MSYVDYFIQFNKYFHSKCPVNNKSQWISFSKIKTNVVNLLEMYFFQSHQVLLVFSSLPVDLLYPKYHSQHPMLNKTF